MMQAILLAVALSWDSLMIGAVDGLFCLSGASKLRMAMLFALYDGGATAVGLSFGRGQPLLSEGLSSSVAIASWCFLVVLVAGRFADRTARTSKWFVRLLPFLFCLDNLAAGPSLTSLSVAPALSCGLAGLVSGLFFFAGSTCGHCAVSRLARLGLAGRAAGCGHKITVACIFSQTQGCDLANCIRGWLRL